MAHDGRWRLSGKSGREEKKTVMVNIFIKAHHIFGKKVESMSVIDMQCRRNRGRRRRKMCGHGKNLAQCILSSAASSSAFVVVVFVISIDVKKLTYHRAMIWHKWAILFSFVVPHTCIVYDNRHWAFSICNAYYIRYNNNPGRRHPFLCWFHCFS